MSKKFNINDYPGKYAMHCKTEEEAKDFCRVLHEAGRKWCTGVSYLENTNWSNTLYGTRIYYNFNRGMYASDESTYTCEGYTILEWSDFMNKKFTKADLKNGDVVLTRNNKVYIVCVDTGTLIGQNGYNRLSDVRDDLTYTTFIGNDYDIIAVRRPLNPDDCRFSAFSDAKGTLVYERDETVEMTLEEVCKALGKNVKIVKEK